MAHPARPRARSLAHGGDPEHALCPALKAVAALSGINRFIPLKRKMPETFDFTRFLMISHAPWQGAAPPAQKHSKA